MTYVPGTTDPDQPVPFTLTPKARAALAVDDTGLECPPVVCLCGSTRFYETFQRANYDLTLRGEIVLTVGFYPHASTLHGHGEGVGHDSASKVALDKLHKRKIDLADYVLVLNVGGYIGESTRSEIGYARARGVPVRYLEPPAPEPCCGCGYDDCSACAGYGWSCLHCADAYFGTVPERRAVPRQPPGRVRARGVLGTGRCPVSPETAARRTAAAAVLADYQRASGSADAPGFQLWAGRLAAMLLLVLEADAAADNRVPRPDGKTRGQELFERWHLAMSGQGIECEPWDALPRADRDAWQAVDEGRRARRGTRATGQGPRRARPVRLGLRRGSRPAADRHDSERHAVVSADRPCPARREAAPA